MSRWAEERRWLLSAVAALVVAAVLVTGWLLARPRSTAGPGAAPVGGSNGASIGGSVGGGVPGWQGPQDTGPRGGAQHPPIGHQPRLSEGSVRVDSYAARGDRLLLSYTTGVPECYGEVVVGPVREGHRSVTVTLRAVTPPRPPAPCIDLAVTGTRTVDLSAPLRDRWVLDGGFVPPALVRPATRPLVE